MAGPVPAFRLSWSRLFKAAFREGEDTLPVQELRERVIQAARAAAEEAGADVPDYEDLKRKFISKLTFSDRLQVDGDRVRLVRKKQRQKKRAAATAAQSHSAGVSPGAGAAQNAFDGSKSRVEWTQCSESQRWGPFSTEEKDALDDAIRRYAAEHGLSASNLDWLFHTRAPEGGQQGRLQRMWYDLAACLPWRSPKQVWQHATRRLHEAKGQGKWSQDEADQLRGLVAQHGPRWTDIGAALGRAPEECKDKWRTLNHGKELKKGAWSVEEQNRLAELVARFQAEAPPPGSGKAFMCVDNLNWEAMAAAMRTRSAQQMRAQWYSRQASAQRGAGASQTEDGGAQAMTAIPSSPSLPGDSPWSHADDAALVRALYDSGACEESEVEWDALVVHRSRAQCLKRWRMLVKTVWAYRDKGFAACVGELLRRS